MLRGDRGLDEPMAAVDGQNGHDAGPAGRSSNLESKREEEAYRLLGGRFLGYIFKSYDDVRYEI